MLKRFRLTGVDWGPYWLLPVYPKHQDKDTQADPQNINSCCSHRECWQRKAKHVKLIKTAPLGAFFFQVALGLWERFSKVPFGIVLHGNGDSKVFCPIPESSGQCIYWANSRGWQDICPPKWSNFSHNKKHSEDLGKWWTWKGLTEVQMTPQIQSFSARAKWMCSRPSMTNDNEKETVVVWPHL